MLHSRAVSKTFHERALRFRSGPSANFVTSAKYPPQGVTSPFFKSDLKASRLESNPSTNSIVKMNNESLLKPSTAEIGKNGASTDLADPGPVGRTMTPTLHQQEKIDPRLQQDFQETSDPTTSQPGQSSAFAALFDSVVYPAIKKSKKRHSDKLPREELDAIGKTVSLTSTWKKMSHSKQVLTLHVDCQRCSEEIGVSLRGFTPSERAHKEENQALCKEVVSSKGQES